VVLGSEVTALDQPFSYPAGTMHLLADRPSARGDEDATVYCSRQTDTDMRKILKEVGLAADYVMTPNRCQNICRALALARLCGLTRREVCRGSARLVETHPRVAWTRALTGWTKNSDAQRLVQTYKGESGSETQRIESRKTALKIFETQTAIRPGGDGVEAEQAIRAQAWDSVDKFEALICAYVALLRSRGETEIAGFPNPIQDQDRLDLEGGAVLPR
jgi:hypothetical protein